MTLKLGYKASAEQFAPGFCWISRSRRSRQGSIPSSLAITSSRGGTPTGTRHRHWHGWAHWAPARNGSSWGPAY